MASIFEQDLILPGVITEIVPDYTAGYDSTAFGTTESVTVVGTAFNGPVGKVTAISTPEHAKYIFGDSFDPTTRRSATLVAEIYDAWARGCRTIYAVRVSGKEIYKDYELAVESNLKLRVRGYFPSNLNKDVFMVYNASQSKGAAGTIRIFKSKDRTNMAEKQQGIVNGSSTDLLVNEINLSDGLGFKKSDRLIDVLDAINSYQNNNVLTLELVNEQGIIMTSASEEVQSLSLGMMFPGVYTIGRDKSGPKLSKKLEIKYIITDETKEETALYFGYEGSIWKKLISNTDASNEYPLFGSVLASELNIIADTNYDYLKKDKMIDDLAVKDKVDYEEVELSGFELYKRLGSGFAKTAKVIDLTKKDDQTGEPVGQPKYKVIQTPENDSNQTVGIVDGLYSMLENHQSNYIVLSCATAETSIHGKLPRKDDFKITASNTIELLATGETAGSGKVLAECKVDKKDFSHKVKYAISIEEGDTSKDAIEAILDDTNILEDSFARIPVIGSTNMASVYEIADGTIAMAIDDATSIEDITTLEGKLVEYSVKAKKFVECNTAKVNATLKYIVEINDELVCVEFVGNKLVHKELVAEKHIIAIAKDIPNFYKVDTANKITPVVSLQAVAGGVDDDENTLVFVEGNIPALPCLLSDNQTIVKVTSNKIGVNGYYTFEEVLDELNKDEILSKKFAFRIAEAFATSIADDFEADVKGSGENKKADLYDDKLYIPYSTTDNFARHLAQHCTYTSLKTFPTHGIIGCSKLSGIDLNTVAERVDQICATEFDLYSKKHNGQNMLNASNLPYPIGGWITITFMQYAVTTGNGYNYMSNGSAGYAGMVSTLDAERSSTNQPIELPGTMFDLSNYQLSRLTAKGIVTCKNTTRGLVITDGVTQAPVDSAYRRLSTTKTINILNATLNETIMPYIGLQDNLATKNSLHTAIKSVLNKLKDKLISDYKFRVLSDPTASKQGIIKIEYKITPVNEIREVRNTISITAK